MSTWRLGRTAQCAKCPWRVAVDPHEIPNGYCEAKHRELAGTIAKPADLSGLGEPLRMMACHETEASPCVGWLHNQLGTGNNIGLRLRVLSCTNIDKLRLRGEQHPNFEATLPRT